MIIPDPSLKADRVYFRFLGFVAYRKDVGSYMERWILRLPTGHMVRLHHILRSDRGRDLHDHPFDFVSLILWGGYEEWTPIPEGYLRGVKVWNLVHGLGWGQFGKNLPGSVIFRRAEDSHRLELARPAWTLVLGGPVRRRWGFHTQDGWVDYEQYRQKIPVDAQ